MMNDEFILHHSLQFIIHTSSFMKIWHAVEIEIARVGESAATAQLWAHGTTGIEVSEETSDFVVLRAWFDLTPDVSRMQEEIIASLRQMNLPDSGLRRVDRLTIADQDWLAEWKKGYEPIEIGDRLLVSPSWKKDQLAGSDRIVIEIDPGMAFGTGTHETTRGCLEMLEKYWAGGSLLDVGTGTGILAIAAARLHPGSIVTGFDVDPEAVAVAEENAAINHVGDEIEFEVNRLSSYAGREFDVIVANLTADVIIPLADQFIQVLKSGGTLIVSGILTEQGDDVIEALQDFKLIESKPDGEWVTFVMQDSRS
ncbi:MAG: 50S ribosomal protein L11 methyltransferase [Acidobacteriota bacterium]|nr:MAG: 50S ribosomal protein L11 methyltransferase [Acidobacteriota bacterium]